MKKRPFFSVITVVLNSRDRIEKCINSVLKQKFKNYEHIIIDGDSTDGTHKILKKYSKKIDKIIIKKDKNMWDGINRGLKISKGKVISILNSDDYFTPNALGIAYKYFTKNKIDYLFGAVKKRKIFYHFNPEKIYYKFNCYPSHSVSFFVKKKIHDELGKYDSNLKFCADYDFFYKLFTNKKYKYLNTKRTELIGYFNIYGLSSKLNIIQILFYESIVRLKNKQNIFIVIFLAFLRIINVFRNYIFK